MKLRLTVICLCVTLTLVIFGCSKSGQGSGKIKLAFVTNGAADFWTLARRGCEQAASELPNVEVEFQIPGDGTAAEQRRIIDDLLAKGISGIAISPIDPVNQTQMINDLASKILVITQDSDAPESNRACYVGTDNVAAGRQAGELINEALPQGGKIMVFVGKADARNAQERFQGIKEALAGSKVGIIDLRTDDTDRVRAKANVADTLVKYPDVGCLVGLWGYNGPAILNALTDAGKVGQIKVVCFDEEDATLAGVKAGSIYATVVQQPYEFGYQSVHLLEKALTGDRAVIPENKLRIVPTLVIKKDIVDEFTARVNKLRGRS
jgi:ribose transport system substrate-binding protein